MMYGSASEEPHKSDRQEGKAQGIQKLHNSNRSPLVAQPCIQEIKNHAYRDQK